MTLISTLAKASERKAHIVLLGGQDTPTLESLRERWKRSMSSVLPPHDLTVVEWPNPAIGRSCGKLERVEIEPSPPLAAAQKGEPQGSLDRLAARAVRTVISGLDKYVRFDSQGRAQSLLGRAIYRFTQFSVDALYDRGGLGRSLLELAEEALSGSHVDLVVAHSFGGTIALRAAWALQERVAKPAPPFALLTLGTASGFTVERAPMFAAYRSARGIERSRQIASWQHFYSKSDAVVGGGQMPRSFLDIDIVKVHTGPFLCRDRGHGLRRYLATPAVRCAIEDAVCRSRLRVAHAQVEPSSLQA